MDHQKQIQNGSTGFCTVGKEAFSLCFEAIVSAQALVIGL